MTEFDIDFRRWNNTPLLHVVVYYRAADGSTKWTDGIYKYIDDAQLLLKSILELQTEFVRSRCLRVEASTPQTMNYGNPEGGFMVLTAIAKATVEPEALRLAHWLERDGANCQAHLDAAAELRRLHHEVERLEVENYVIVCLLCVAKPVIGEAMQQRPHLRKQYDLISDAIAKAESSK